MNMKTKKGKYIKGNQSSVSIWLIIGVIAVVIAVVIASSIILNSKEETSEEKPELPTTSTQGTEATSDATKAANTEELLAEINTTYCTFQLPQEFLVNLDHREVTEGTVAMNIFSLRTESKEMELFRIFFGAQDIGIPMGYFEMESGMIPVGYIVCVYSEEDFINKEIEDLYYFTMEAFQFVMDSVRDDDCFREIDDTIILDET